MKCRHLPKETSEQLSFEEGKETMPGLLSSRAVLLVRFLTSLQLSFIFDF